MWVRRRHQSQAPYFLASIVAAYLAWPYYGLYAFSTALESGDREALENSVDFPSVRESLKQEATAAMAAAAAEDASDNPLAAGLMAAFAPILIDGLVDGFVTPSGLASVIQGKRLKLDASESPTEEGSHAGGAFRLNDLRYAFFASPTAFRIETSKDLVLYFHIQDWRWKLSRIALPPSAFDVPGAPAA